MGMLRMNDFFLNGSYLILIEFKFFFLDLLIIPNQVHVIKITPEVFLIHIQKLKTLNIF